MPPGLGALFLLTGEHGSAHALYEEALAIARQTADATGEAGALEKLGVLNRHRGDMAAAETLLAEALARARESSDARGQLGALANLATVYIQSGRHDLAREHYGQGLELAKSVGDRLVEGVILGNLATLHHERGNRPEAEKLYEEALAIHREVGDRAVEGHTLGNLGICRHQGGDLHAARELYEQALAISREVGDRAGEGGVTAQLAALERDEGNIEEALACSEGSRPPARSGDRSYEATTLQILAAIHRQGIGDHAIAAGLLDDAHAILLDLGDRVELAKCLCQISHLGLARGTPARELLTRAERLAAELGVAGDSELGAMIAMLAEAVGASESGFQLFRGELPERLPEGLWRWLVSSAQIS
ncbi:MAG: tetratricopeptide repeat protein [Acidobacteriota bacterium]